MFTQSLLNVLISFHISPSKFNESKKLGSSTFINSSCMHYPSKICGSIRIYNLDDSKINVFNPFDLATLTQLPVTYMSNPCQ